MGVRWGLRGKSALALLTACLVALVPALLIGWLAVDAVRQQFSQAYAENFTLLQMQRILAPISRELALAERFAQSPVTRDWLADEQDPAKRQRFFDEAESYRQGFAAHTYFAVADASGDYYFSSDDEPTDRRPRYRLSAADPDDSWYSHLIASGQPYTLNVNIDRELQEAKVWINVVIRDDGRPLGIAGTGLDLSRFLDAFIRTRAHGITPMIVNRQGALLAYPDASRIAFNAQADNGDLARGQQLAALLGGEDERAELREVIQRAVADPDDVYMLTAHLDGQPRLLSVGYVPQLDWLMVTALDRQSAQLIATHWLWPLSLGAVVLLVLLLAGFIYTSERLILAPLRRLKQSAQAIADGRYDSRLPVQRGDEIGELSRAFADMAAQVERHTQQLEATVRQRTAALEATNREMAQAHRQIESSLAYASLIQRAILPGETLDARLGSRYGVIWQPRDQVGGDIFIFHATPEGYLLGVIDCAGHGVPGALMTMLVKASIDHAVLRLGCADPAAILDDVDARCRELLQREALTANLATDIDMGLVWIDERQRRMRFAGAKMALHVADGERLECHPGGRRALMQKRRMRYANLELPLRPGASYTLCSDGFLDQAGGERGFGFGRQRFAEMLTRHATLTPTGQVAAFAEALAAYSGTHPQRDDITLLVFQPDPGSRPT